MDRFTTEAQRHREAERNAAGALPARYVCSGRDAARIYFFSVPLCLCGSPIQ
jgi:hypothetical protein